MPKRKRQESNDGVACGETGFCLKPTAQPLLNPSNLDCSAPRRKSARLQDIQRRKTEHSSLQPRQLPSPSTSRSDKRVREKAGKRKTERRQHSKEAHICSAEKNEPAQELAAFRHQGTHSFIAYWATNSRWPPEVWKDGFNMTDSPASKRKSSSSSTTHRSAVLERMAAHGVNMHSSNLIKKTSAALCQQYLQGQWDVVQTTVFSTVEFDQVLQRVQSLNEARLQRDVMPWVVPSAEVLFFRGEQGLDYIGDELDAEWIRCATMGSKKPKPDYTAGLRPRAFSEEERRKLENYAQPLQPFRFTPELCFPFLMCEAKTGERGLNQADRQNIHSASIAVRAIFQLYRTAFAESAPYKIEELYGEVLVFTVSHDNDRVLLYGHFAVADSSLPDDLQFYRHQIALYSLTAGVGVDRLRAYNFVRNIYEQFAPVHRQRIQEAVAQLPAPAQRTDPSFAMSDTALDGTGSEQDSQDTVSQSENGFRKPGPPASASQAREVGKLREQMDKLLGLIEEQRQDNKRQLEEQRQDNKRQLEEQRQDSERRLEEQRQDSERRLQDIISLLRESRSQ